MKLFISYCEKDGEGLPFARKAKGLCKERGIEAWVWRDDSSSAEWLKTDIVNNIEACDAMFTIVTAGTENSEPQKEEWSLAGSFNKVNSSIRRSGLSIPAELRSRKCPEFSDSSFDKVCGKAIGDIAEYLESHRSWQAKETAVKEYQLHNIAEPLEKRQEGLSRKTVEEFARSVWEGYLGSTVIRNMVSLAEANEEDKGRLRHIAIRSNIDLNKFNAKDYWWGPAFKQLGQAIAAGEKRLLVERIQSEVKEISEPCNEKDDELSTVVKEIERLNSIGRMPDVILAPPSMLKSFVHFFNGENGKIDFTREQGSTATLEVKDTAKLGIYVLGGGILSENVIVFSRSDVVWRVVLNPDTGYALGMAVGRGWYPDKVAFIVGTTIRCVVAAGEGITRIPIKR